VEQQRLMAEAAAGTVKVVSAVRPADLGRPTPCEQYDVEALLGHLLWVADLSVAAARRVPPTVEQAPDHLPDDWKPHFESQVAALVDAWTEPATWEGTTSLAGTELPAAVAGLIVFCDLVVHGWDLSRALGIDHPWDDDGDVAQATLDVMAQMGDQGRAMGAFGPAVPVDDDAPALARALADSGRDPNWTATA